MPRPRKGRNAALPLHVYVDKRGRIFFRDPQSKRETTLGRWGETPLAAVHDRAQALANPQPDSLRSLLQAFHDSAKFRQLSPATQRHYEDYRRDITTTKLKGGSSFGDVSVRSITTQTLIAYHERKADTPVAANRRIQYLGSAFSWALRRKLVDQNPCTGVQLFDTKPRDRYVTDEEYLAVLELALDRGAIYLAPAMEIAYLCRARLGEVLGLTHGSVTQEGLYIRRSKASRSEITLWSDRLWRAVNHCAEHAGVERLPTTDAPVLFGRDGRAVSKFQWRSAWNRLMKTAAKQGIARFNFHDLKAKGATDDERRDAGHRSGRMRDVYLRAPEKRPGTK